MREEGVLVGIGVSGNVSELIRVSCARVCEDQRARRRQEWGGR